MVARAKVYKVTGAYGYDAGYSQYRQNATRCIIYRGEAHGRNGSRYGVIDIGVMGCHVKVFHEIVDMAHLNGQYNTKGHGQNHH